MCCTYCSNGLLILFSLCGNGSKGISIISWWSEYFESFKSENWKIVYFFGPTNMNFVNFFNSNKSPWDAILCTRYSCFATGFNLVCHSLIFEMISSNKCKKKKYFSCKFVVLIQCQKPENSILSIDQCYCYTFLVTFKM